MTAFERISVGRLKSLLERSVRVYSPTYAESSVIPVYVGALSSHSDIILEKQPVPGPSDDSFRTNLIAHLGPKENIKLLFVGHIDTIPLQHEEKTRSVRWEDDTLYGLGSADMKAGCASMVEALLAIADSAEELHSGVAVALVVGEEEYGDGAIALVEKYKAQVAVVGEPTSLICCSKHLGYVEYELTAIGKQKHAALAEKSQNAIHGILSWIHRFFDEVGLLQGDSKFIVNVREIKGGGNLFVTPDECKAILDLHIPPYFNIESIETLLYRTYQETEEYFPCSFQFERTYVCEGYKIEENSSFIENLKKAYLRCDKPFIEAEFPSHCDAPVLQRSGITSVVCGPGSLEHAHTKKERVSFQEVLDMARIYEELIRITCIEV